jgi:porin
MRHAIFSGILLAASPAAVADEAKMSPREFFLDQPKGLGEHDFAWKLIYVGESFGNTAGGMNRAAVYEGTLKAGFGLNLERLLGWDSTTFYANVLIPHGEGLTQHHAGDLNVISNIDTNDSIRLYKLWLQKAFDDGRWNVRIGQIAADKESFVSDGAALFFNNAFGTFPSISSTFPAPIFPLSAPGLRVRWAPSDEFSAQVMFFSGDAGNAETNQHNTRWAIHGRNGLLTLAELAWKHNQAEDSEGLPATIKVGGLYDSKRFDDQSGSGTHLGDYAFYAMADQWLYRAPSADKGNKRGLSVFARAGAAPQQDRNVITFDFESGVDFIGPFASRPQDVLGAGFATTRLGESYVRANDGRAHRESVVELSYAAVLGDHVALQPDLQYIITPGGLGKLSNVLAIGLRLTVSF